MGWVIDINIPRFNECHEYIENLVYHRSEEK
jgi:hypothetical protein